MARFSPIEIAGSANDIARVIEKQNLGVGSRSNRKRYNPSSFVPPSPFQLVDGRHSPPEHRAGVSGLFENFSLTRPSPRSAAHFLRVRR